MALQYVYSNGCAASACMLVHETYSLWRKRQIPQLTKLLHELGSMGTFTWQLPASATSAEHLKSQRMSQQRT